MTLKNNNICIVASQIPPNYAGGGRRLYNQAKYLSSNGYNTTIVTNTNNNQEEHDNLEIKIIELPDWYINKDIKTILRLIFMIIYQPVIVFKLFKYLNKDKIDVVHLINSRSRLSLYTILICKAKSISIINSTTLLGSDDPKTIREDKGRILYWIYFKLPDKIVNNSPILYQVCKKEGIPEEKLQYIPNPVDTTYFKPPQNKSEKIQLKSHFDFNNDHLILLTASLIYKRKRVRELIHVFKHVKKKSKNISLVIAGPTSRDEETKKEYNHLKSLIHKYEIDDVIFLGNVNEIESLMKASDIFVFASEREGMPNVLLEAMSTGLPSVVYEIPTVTQELYYSHNGIVVKSRKQFEEELLNLIDNEELRKVYANQARKCAEEKFSMETVMAQYVKLYKYSMK